MHGALYILSFLEFLRQIIFAILGDRNTPAAMVVWRLNTRLSIKTLWVRIPPTANSFHHALVFRVYSVHSGKMATGFRLLIRRGHRLRRLKTIPDVLGTNRNKQTEIHIRVSLKYTYTYTHTHIRTHIQMHTPRCM